MEINELKMLQALPLDVKIMKSKLRIEEWYRFWGGQVYISFSGGKDSTVLLHLVRSLYPNVQAVYADTGLEYPELRDFVRTFENVIWLKPRLTFPEVIIKHGYPVISKEQSHYIDKARNSKSEKLRNKHILGIMPDGSKTSFTISKKWRYLLNAPFKISDHCCYVMKKYPIEKYERQTKNKGFIGLLAQESTMREKNYVKTGCNAFEGKRPLSSPLGFWTEQDILEYLVKNNLPIASVYGDIKLYTPEEGKPFYKCTKLNRTGCMFCMYGVHLEKGENRFQFMQRTHPKQWDYCMRGGEFVDGVWQPKNGLGMSYVLDFINVPYETQISINDLIP